MKTTVILPVHNGAPYLRACLAALLAQRDDTVQVLAVDNGSHDGSADLIAREFPVVRVLHFAQPLGFSGAVNAGIRAVLFAEESERTAADAPDIVIILNQDTEVHPGWLAALCAPFQTHEQIGMVGSKALFPDGRIQHAGGELLWPLGYGRNRGHGEPDYGQYDDVDEPPYLSGVVVALRATMLNTIGLFDEGFNPAYFEDVDMCLRAKRAGWTLSYTPAAVLTHHEGARKASGDYEHAALLERNRLRLVLKHSSVNDLLTTFFPAEEAHLRERTGTHSAYVLRRSYFDALLMLTELAPQCQWHQQYDAIVDALTHLRHIAIEAQQHAVIADLAEEATRATEPPIPPPPVEEESSDVVPASPVDPRPATLPPVTVLILTWNGLAYTQECLESLRTLTAGVDYHVIVVDNGSTDGTRDYLRSLSWVTLIENETNEGFTRGNNRGLRALPDGHDVILLNNDTRIIQPHWLARLREVIHSEPDYGIAGCRLLMDNGHLLHVGTYMPTNTFWGQQIGATEENIGQYPGVREVQGIVGACMYIRRDALDRIGLLDERFFSYFEDTDYCLRAIEAGYRIICVGDVDVVHHENVSTRLNQVNWSSMFWPSQQQFLEKWENYYRTMYTQRVFWHSLVSAPSGYATSSRNLLLALDHLRVDIRLAYLYGTDFSEPNSGDPRIEQMRHRPKDTTLPQVVYGQGDMFHKNSGCYRIGYTMLEVTGIPDEWVSQANQMDEVWVTSEFNRETFAESGVKRPIEVMPLGVDVNYFHPGIRSQRMSERYTFLSVFEWGERKAPEILLRAYASAFTANDDVLLVLKVDNRDGDVNIARQIDDLHLPPNAPPILLLHNQALPAYQMGCLYRSADCFVLPTRGEGWGMPILEAMACGLPTIATNWSAQTMFLHEAYSYPLRVNRLVPAIAKCPYYAGFFWAEPDEDHLVYLLRHVYHQRERAQATGRRAAEVVAQRWTWEHAAQRILARLVALKEEF